jgi:uncharacterized membrane protein
LLREVDMRRVLGLLLIVVAAVVTLLGVVLAVQMAGHTAAWQVVAFAVLVVGVGWLLQRTGRRLRA